MGRGRSPLTSAASRIGEGGREGEEKAGESRASTSPSIPSTAKKEEGKRSPERGDPSTSPLISTARRCVLKGNRVESSSYFLNAGGRREEEGEG